MPNSHEDGRALSAFDLFRLAVPMDGSTAQHSFNRSFGVIAFASVASAEEKLRIGLNDGAGHNFESYWLWDCDRLT